MTKTEIVSPRRGLRKNLDLGITRAKLSGEVGRIAITQRATRRIRNATPSVRNYQVITKVAEPPLMWVTVVSASTISLDLIFTTAHVSMLHVYSPPFFPVECTYRHLQYTKFETLIS